MELLVATWTVRLSLVGGLIVGWVSMAMGLGMVDVAVRVGLTAFILTFAGRQLMSLLETPEQRMMRLRLKRAKKRGDT
jgi:hypothetical protein